MRRKTVRISQNMCFSHLADKYAYHIAKYEKNKNLNQGLPNHIGPRLLPRCWHCPFHWRRSVVTRSRATRRRPDVTCDATGTRWMNSTTYGGYARDMQRIFYGYEGSWTEFGKHLQKTNVLIHAKYGVAQIVPFNRFWVWAKPLEKMTIMITNLVITWLR